MYGMVYITAYGEESEKEFPDFSQLIDFVDAALINSWDFACFDFDGTEITDLCLRHATIH